MNLYIVLFQELKIFLRKYFRKYYRNFELSLFEENNEMNNKIKEIKSRILNLLNKYNKIMKNN